MVKSSKTSGIVTGEISYDLDNYLQVSALNVNNQSFTINRDIDGKVTQIADLSIAYNDTTGIIDSTKIEAITKHPLFNTQGQMTEMTWKLDNTELMRFNYSYNTIGKITDIEHYNNGTFNKKLSYHYNLDGRLDSVF